MSDQSSSNLDIRDREESVRYERYAKDIAARLPLMEKECDDEPLPDFASAKRLFGKMRENRYVSYMIEFRAKNPIMYAVFYRWWLVRGAPKPIQEHIPRIVRVGGAYASRWPDFAMHHPVLFFLWLILFASFQFFVKLLTAPIQTIFSYFWVKRGSTDVMSDAKVDHEFVNKCGNVLPE